MSRCDMKSLRCILWNCSGVLCDRLLENSLAETPVVYYHKLAQAADKHRFHYETTAKRCETLLL